VGYFFVHRKGINMARRNELLKAATFIARTTGKGRYSCYQAGSK
jgi:hypothetical protein